MSDDIQVNHTVSAYIAGEDPRYPTLVIQGDFGSRGYSVNPVTGDLSRVCLCHAYDESECCCGAWYDSENNDDY